LACACVGNALLAFDCNQLGRDGKNHLHRAADKSKEESENFRNALSLPGLDLNSQDDDGMTALHYATKRDNLLFVKALLKSGAKVTLKDKYGRTPIDYAETAKIKTLLEQHLPPTSSLSATSIHHPSSHPESEPRHPVSDI
jgi:ankyrin repeat protein